jgi:hypothetical protein
LVLALALLSRTNQKGSQLPAVVLPALVMPSFEHGEGTILDVRIRQCRDQVLSLPFVLIIHFLQDGVRKPHEMMTLDRVPCDVKTSKLRYHLSLAFGIA